MIKRILLGFLFLSASYGIVAKNLPLPSFPASFEVVEYQGKKNRGQVTCLIILLNLSE